MEQAKIVEILPTRIWVESDMLGSRHVVMHHQGFGDPFTYATFFYDYAYTSNGGTWDAAHNLALALGATEPVEAKQRDLDLTMPSADEVRAQIDSLTELLKSIETASA